MNDSASPRVTLANSVQKQNAAPSSSRGMRRRAVRRLSLAKIEANGGKAIMPKTEIPGVGWFGVFADATGGTLALYTGNPEANPEG